MHKGPEDISICFPLQLRLLLFVFLSLVAINVTITIALKTTIYPGLPTVSLLLAEQLWFTVSTVIFLITWIICMAILLSSVAPRPILTKKEEDGIEDDDDDDDDENMSSNKSTQYGEDEEDSLPVDCCIRTSECFGYLYYPFIYLAILHIGMIPVVKLTEYPLFHYIITGLLIVYWQFCQTFLFISRCIVFYKNKSSHRVENHRYILFANLLVILIAGISGAVFVGLSYNQYMAEYYTNVAVSEYLVFECWFTAPIFHWLEISNALMDHKKRLEKFNKMYNELKALFSKNTKQRHLLKPLNEIFLQKNLKRL